jgi:ABC-2 type transport system permease protein
MPAITMRSFAEEYQSGAIELLATRPLRSADIVLGKFLAALALAGLALVPTLLYYFTVYQLGAPKGNLDAGAIIGSYLGLILLAGAFSSIGIMASSLQNNQITAFLLAAFLCFLLHWGFDLFSSLPVFSGSGDAIIQSIGMQSHYQSISRGVVDSRDVIYFLSVIVFFLAATGTALRVRR